MKLVFTTGVVMMSALALVACQSEQGAQTGPTPAAPSPSESVPGGLAETENSPAIPSPNPAVTPDPEPTVLEIRADDLVSALPTNKQMSKIQGFKFKENTRWVGGADEGPQWVNDTPLTKKQANQVSFGANRSVRPERCAALGVMDAYGIPSRWATPDTVSAVGFSRRVNDTRSARKNLVASWDQVIYVMAAGKAQEWVTNAANLWPVCKRLTLVRSGGDIRKENRGELIADLVLGKSGAAFVLTASPEVRKEFRGGQVVNVSEPIGNAVLRSYFVITMADDESLERASEVYNVLADNLAEAQGVERERVDLVSPQPFTPQPEGVGPPSPPVNEMA